MIAPVDAIPIALLAPGEVAEITQVIGCSELVVRLEELGLRCGVSITMVQPGTPCILCVDGSRLAFRDSELCGVLVNRELTR